MSSLPPPATIPVFAFRSPLSRIFVDSEVRATGVYMPFVTEAREPSFGCHAKEILSCDIKWWIVRQVVRPRHPLVARKNRFIIGI